MSLCLAIKSLDILGVFLLSLSTMNKGSIELFERQVAGSEITVNDFLNEKLDTLLRSY